jgi:hypothetical protein
MGRPCHRLIFHKENVKFGFKNTSIWPFNPEAMDNKTQPSLQQTSTTFPQFHIHEFSLEIPRLAMT